MEPLSSFAINLAAGIALNVFDKVQNTVDKSIKKAFEDATKDWSKNNIIRNQNYPKLKLELDSYLLNLKTCNEKEHVSIFIEYFNKRLCENKSAYNYLNQIKDEKRHKLEIEYLKGLKRGQNEIIETIQKNKFEIEKLANIVKKISETQSISKSSSHSTILSLLQAKKTVENLIFSYKKSVSDKEIEIAKLEKDIRQFERDIQMIDENINLLKNGK